MVDDINALQRLELKEAFDEFDKVMIKSNLNVWSMFWHILVIYNNYSRRVCNLLILCKFIGRQRYNYNKRITSSTKIDRTKSNRRWNPWISDRIWRQWWWYHWLWWIYRDDDKGRKILEIDTETQIIHLPLHISNEMWSRRFI